MRLGFSNIASKVLSVEGFTIPHLKPYEKSFQKRYSNNWWAAWFLRYRSKCTSSQRDKLHKIALFFERFPTLFFCQFFCEITQKWQCSQHGDQYSWGYYNFLWWKPLQLDPDSNTLPTQTLKMPRKLANRIKNCKTPTSRSCSQNV